MRTMGFVSLCAVLVLPVATRAAEEGASAGLEEIVVTAQRRTERLQDVPISVSVMSQAAMDAQGTRSIDDVARLTPSVNFTRGTVNNNFESSNIAIRGIDSSAGAATTGLYIDDTPIQSRHLSFGTFNAYPALFDMERVEVLRGPQGTLFGAGSEGGTVRFISPEPNLTKSSIYGRAEAAGTQHGDPVYELGVAGGTPLIQDSLPSGPASRDGTKAATSTATTGHQHACRQARQFQQDHHGARLKWAATDSLTVTPSVSYQKHRR
ncbi:MAG: TonB-dependent receptor plug domain-containing protein [Steroidobacteraceae bacterium]